MRRFQDLRIRFKLAIPMLVMGAIGIGSAVYGAVEFGRIEKTYSDLISQRATAILDSARAASAMREIVGNLYQAIAYPEFMKQNATSIEKVKAAHAASLQALVEAKISFPQRAESFDELSRRLQAAKSDIDQIIAQAARDEDLPALSIMSQLDRTISEIAGAAAKVNDEIKKDTEATSEALAAAAQRVNLIAIGLSVAGSLLGLIGGALLTAIAITRPLERLKLRMGQIASGDHGVDVEGRTAATRSARWPAPFRCSRRTGSPSSASRARRKPAVPLPSASVWRSRPSAPPPPRHSSVSPPSRPSWSGRWPRA